MDLLRRQVSDNANDDQNVGSARDSSSSASSLLSTLIPALVIAAIYVIFFLVLRAKFPRQYSPRTYLGALRKEERSPALPNSMFGWIHKFRQIPDIFVLQHNSMDAYFLLRFLKLVVVICLVGVLITWPILFPINATGGGGQKQLNVISYSNISGANKDRYYAHLFITWIYLGFIFYMVSREMIYFINVRQAYLLSPLYASRISSKTVLFQCVPLEYANEQKIRQMFGNDLKNVWVASDTKELEDLVDERTKAAMKLEAAETKLIKTANDARLKALKKEGEAPRPIPDDELGQESGSAAAQFVKPSDRPTHKLKFLIGKKVDTINWAREEIARLNPRIEKLQDMHRAGDANAKNAVFIEFHDQNKAQSAYQMVAHHQPLHMAPRIIGLSPDEIVWRNMGITWRTMGLRNLISISVVAALIVFWSIPVAFVGSISQINTLTKVLPFLNFINNVPTALLGVITGLLPTVMLAILMSLLPPFLRFMAKVGGKATLSLVELRTHESYFWFQVIQVFLVTTMTSAASSAVPAIIQTPTGIPALLASSLPKSSNFYISYFVLQGLTFSSGALLQVVGLLLYFVMSKFLDTTPRKMYKRFSNLSALGWGTVFPVIELLGVVAIAYSTIAPLVLGFATVGIFLFYLAFRYNVMFVNTSSVDTKGQVYPKALKHLLVGCYLSAICMLGLFAASTSFGPMILMIIFLIGMILFHISLLNAVNPLLNYLPRSLEAEEEALLMAEDSELTPTDTRLSADNTIDNDKADQNEKLRAAKKSKIGVKSMKAPSDNPSMFKKFLRPDIYCSYAAMRKLVPQDFVGIQYSTELERDAYNHPAISNVVPLLWIPRDEMGISKQECLHTNKVTPMTDEGAWFDSKGKIVWDENESKGHAPIWEEKIYW